MFGDNVQLKGFYLSKLKTTCFTLLYKLKETKIGKFKPIWGLRIMWGNFNLSYKLWHSRNTFPLLWACSAYWRIVWAVVNLQLDSCKQINPASTEKFFSEFWSNISVCFPLRPLYMRSERKFLLSLLEVWFLDATQFVRLVLTGVRVTNFLNIANLDLFFYTEHMYWPKNWICKKR